MDREELERARLDRVAMEIGGQLRLDLSRSVPAGLTTPRQPRGLTAEEEWVEWLDSLDEWEAAMIRLRSR